MRDRGIIVSRCQIVVYPSVFYGDRNRSATGLVGQRSKTKRTGRVSTGIAYRWIRD